MKILSSTICFVNGLDYFKEDFANQLVRIPVCFVHEDLFLQTWTICVQYYIKQILWGEFKH